MFLSFDFFSLRVRAQLCFLGLVWYKVAMKMLAYTANSRHLEVACPWPCASLLSSCCYQSLCWVLNLWRWLSSPKDGGRTHFPWLINLIKTIPFSNHYTKIICPLFKQVAWFIFNRILFVFHKNGHLNYKAKVQPPRLNGAKTGVFSTRSPHRPNAIGLTLAKLEKVEGNSLTVLC